MDCAYPICDMTKKENKNISMFWVGIVLVLFSYIFKIFWVTIGPNS